MKFLRLSVASVPALMFASLPCMAFAQEPAPAPEPPPPATGTLAQAPATTGTTEIGGAGFQAAPVPVAASKDALEFALSAGGQFATGNAKSIAVTGASNFRLRRSENQFTAGIAGNYGRAALPPVKKMQTTVENVQVAARYDRFVYKGLAVFLGMAARNDRFQGLTLRLNVDPGLAYYVIDQAKHRLWFEAGYDFQHDLRHKDALAAAVAAGAPLAERESRHSARLFGGYNNQFNEHVGLNTGLEYIQSVQSAKLYRLGYDIGLTANLVQRLSLATTFSLRYDNRPLPAIEKLDTVAALNFVYSIL